MLLLVCFIFSLFASKSDCHVLIHSGTWNFRGHPIAFEKAEFASTALPPVSEVNGVENIRTDEPKPILVLNGFGVGSFHQHRLIHQIFGQNEQMQNSPPPPQGQLVYCIDYLGQGKSWPRECQDGDGPSEANLRYCGQTWVDQIIHFIEEVIFTRERSDGDGLLNRKVHIMGNSVGGHLAVFLAVQRPEYVESLALLNATPVWGLNLPGWNGRLPAPWLPKVVGRYLFDRIRDLQTIETYLEAAYFNRAAFDNSLIQQIRDSTEITNGGHAAFASILWSPPIDFDRNSNKQQTFYQALSTLDGDVLMLFGRDDPWCKPAFARRMLEQVPRHVASRYVEMANVGHCPNHEAPIATAFVLRKWWQASHEQRKSDDSFITNVIIKERWGQTELQERKSQDIELSLLDQIAVAFV